MAVNANNQNHINNHPVLKVFGLGGGGGNAVNRMIALGLKGVKFIAANTDHQDLESNLAPVKIQLGPRSTRGLGAGGNPEIGRVAAEESHKEIRAALEGTDMVFLTAGMGGGTGTGSISVVGRIAKEMGIVTIAVVTTPFSFEVGRRQVNAREGLSALRPNTDTLIAIPNDRLLFNDQWSQNISLEMAFQLADDVLRQAVMGISELVTEPGVINVDFSHIREVMRRGGGALMTIGQGSGEEKALKAINQALNHPLLETINLENAAGVIANFTGGKDLSLYDVGEALNHIQDLAGSDVDVILGFNNDNRLDEKVQVILVITGLGAQTLEDIIPGSEQKISEKVADPLEEFMFDVPEPTPDLDNDQEDKESKTVPFTSSPKNNLAVQSDLDIPAFLRRRTRYQTSTQG
ncbi:MAG: cell division protein FtsZ [candidate division Zixibacteria bacterium]|nr:cell division protein FtsZ [Gammaproteobacteria bacterium]NIX55993.1 cell division protein FtsZ [candidate division Zixibacteria bacterium]